MQDGQGSVRDLTSSAGSITDTFSYTAFGETYSQTGTTTNPYLYTGQQFDSLTGLYSLRARYYAPQAGRFTSRDTFVYDFENPLEINRYAYTANNPINRADPSGHDAAGEYAELLPEEESASSAIESVGEEFASESESLVEEFDPLNETSNLRTNMFRYGDTLGREPNPGDFAHHIVEQGRTGAQPARDILEKWGIDINSHYNGLWLDNTTHYTTYPRVYTTAVNNVISVADAGGRGAIQTALREIAQGILAGTFP